MSSQIPSVDKLVNFDEKQLVFKKDLSLKEWLSIGRVFEATEASRLWWMGDWCNYGEEKFGEKYSQALQSSDYNYGTLRNASYVAKAFPPEMRNLNLTWSHHYPVAQLGDGDKLEVLAKAEKEVWNVKEIRQAVVQITGKEPKKVKLEFNQWVETIEESEMKESTNFQLLKMGWEAGQENK